MASIAKFDTWQNTAGVARQTILQVVTTPFTAAFSAANSASDFQNVSGFAATITPYSASSRIVVTISMGCAGAQTGVANSTGWRITRNGAAVLIGDASSSRPRSSFTTTHSAINADHAFMAHFSGIDSPSTTSACTYQLQFWTEGNSTTYINRVPNFADEAQPYRSIRHSSITLMEIAA